MRVSEIRVRKNLASSEFSRARKKKCNNAFALAKSCGRLAAFTAPLSDSRDVRAAAVGRAENFHSGGRATWASLFW